MEISLYSAPDTAYILRKELGPIFAWDDFLATGRKNSKDHTGPMLYPTCQIRRRPYYNLRDIAEFIVMMRRTRGGTRANHLESIKVDLSPADLLTHWKLVNAKITASAGASALAY